MSFISLHKSGTVHECKSENSKLKNCKNIHNGEWFCTEEGGCAYGNNVETVFPDVKRAGNFACRNSKQELRDLFEEWTEEQQGEFLDFCTGVRGIKFYHNKNEYMRKTKFDNKLEAWLAFLCMDDPEVVVWLIEQYPEFRAMYEEAYQMCQNMDEVMRMFSKELLELDRNTVQLMIDEMQDEINVQRKALKEQVSQLEQQRN